MGTLASGSIDLKSLKVAGESNKYITFIDSTNGIRVHEAGAVNTNFAQINSSGMQIYRDGASVASFGSTARIGTASGARAETTSTGLDVYNSSNQKKASYGSTQYIYGGSGTYPLAEVGSSAVKLMQSANNYAQVDSDGLKVYKGGDKVAEFGSTSTIGVEDESHVEISDTSVSIWNDDTCAVSLEGGTTPYITYGHINFVPNDLGMGICEIAGDRAPIWGDGDTTIGEMVSTTMIARADSGNDASITLTSVDSSDADIGTYASVTISPSLTINDHSSPIGDLQSASANVAITTANINTYAVGPGITLSPGSWIIRGIWQYNSVTGARVIDVDLATDNSTAASTTTLIARQRVSNATGAWARLEVISLATPTTDTPIYVKGSSTLTSTAQACYIYAMRIA